MANVQSDYITIPDDTTVYYFIREIDTGDLSITEDPDDVVDAKQNRDLLSQNRSTAGNLYLWYGNLTSSASVDANGLPTHAWMVANALKIGPGEAYEPYTQTSGRIIICADDAEVILHHISH